MPKCPTCEGLRDKRSYQCQDCRFKYNHPRKGTGASPDGFAVTARGYIARRINGKLKYQHRLVMEEFLGRELREDEHVHHKNGIKTDNRLENLEVIESSEHHRQHMLEDGRAKEMSILGHAARWGK